MPPALPELPGVTHRFLDLPTGVRVHVAEAGPAGAPPVLALHGWPQHWWIWRRVIERLDGEFRLVCPDLRGFGWSGRPADGDFAKDRLADDALALMDALELEDANVMGHDWGGWVGILLGLREPARVRTLLIMGILHPWQPTAKAVRNAWRFAYQVPVALPVVGPAVMRDGRFAQMMLRGGWGEKSSWDQAAADAYVAAVGEPNQADASSRLYRAFLVRELGPGRRRFAGRRLAMPTRLLFGRRDGLGPELAEGLERHGDDAGVELIDGCGHFVPEERPDLVAERARALFA